MDNPIYKLLKGWYKNAHKKATLYSTNVIKAVYDISHSNEKTVDLSI